MAAIVLTLLTTAVFLPLLLQPLLDGDGDDEWLDSLSDWRGQGMIAVV